ncbi:hypothetical protein [Laspinema olomoucense]|uniref:Uncharacterized protein n=1 Tax=Laspinema olomoucense D3b TaxID=2953688 RepID=A0ABT2NFX9_9CYAN|nr:hypothetical protein [Laspinema sp. D3b]MCT7981596.1 hypothetical protein [Laspinema sp. D3b]
MPLSTKKANKPVIDDHGYVTGTIVNIEECESNFNQEQFEFTIESQGTSKVINFKLWTGQNLNSKKFPYGEPDKKSNKKSKTEENENLDYNKLTRLSLNLGMIKESELLADKVENFDLETLKGKEVQFKLEVVKGKTLQTIDLSSIKFAKK